MKKAQGLSMNTIIIAALGLAVLVVLFAVFTGRIAIFTEGVGSADSCEQKCNAISMTKNPNVFLASECVAPDTSLAGKYKDSPVNPATGQPGDCCCQPR